MLWCVCVYGSFIDLTCRLGTLNGNDYVPFYLQKRIRTEVCIRYPSDSQLESLAALIHSGTTSGTVRLKPGNEIEWIKSVGFLAPYADMFAMSLTEYKIEPSEKSDEIKADNLSIIREMGARANETGHSFPRIAYCILGTGVMSSSVFLEAPPRVPTWQVYKAIRRRAYALLFSLKQSDALPLKDVAIETVSFSTVHTESNYCVEGTETPDAEFYKALPSKYKFSSYEEAVSAPL